VKPPTAAFGLVVLIALALTGCSTSLVGTTPPTSAIPASSGSTTTAPLNGEVAVAFPVAACTTASGGSLGSQGWKPSILLAPIPTSLIGKVQFYSDGVHILLGPNDWSCSQVQSPTTGSGLVVYPSGDPNPPTSWPPAAGGEGVFATFDTTGDPQGIAMVCQFFTIPSWQQQEAPSCSSGKPVGEQISMATPDVASVTDPTGVVGFLAGSGGPYPVTGTVIFPQAVPQVAYGSSVSVAEESCSLSDTALCPTVLSDFEVREFPVPSGSGN